MKMFILFFVLTPGPGQTFFGEIACNKAMHMWAERGVETFCTARHIK